MFIGSAQMGCYDKSPGFAGGIYLNIKMVGVAQLVELRIVIPAVVGSSPIVHPIQPWRLYSRILHNK